MEMANRSDPAALLTDCQSGIKKLKRGEAGAARNICTFEQKLLEIA